MGKAVQRIPGQGGPGLWRVFGGKRYYYEAPFNSKVAAKNFADRARKRNSQARITTAKDRQGRKYYIVWLHG